MFRLIIAIIVIVVFIFAYRRWLKPKGKIIIRISIGVIVLLVLYILFSPRSGKEIYASFFDSSRAECLKIINYQDQAPVFDDAIFLEFQTCPYELKRILLFHDYKVEKKSKKSSDLGGIMQPDGEWFMPSALGDSILVFTYEKEGIGNQQKIYSSIDSSWVYFIDYQLN